MDKFDLRVFRFGAFDRWLVVCLFEPVFVFREGQETWIVRMVSGGQQFPLLADVEGAGRHFVPILVSIEFCWALRLPLAIVPDDLDFSERLGLVEHRNGGCGWEGDVRCVVNFCLDAIRIAEVAGEKRTVHGVAPHVPDCTRAVFTVSAPSEGMEFWGVRHFGALGEPGLPVEVGWDGFGDEGVFGFLALGPDGAVGPDVDFFHASDDSHGEVFFEEADAFD